MSRSIYNSIREWQDRLNEASGKWGGVEICAVTKTVAPEIINEVWDAGIRTLGENRVQELLSKLEQLHEGFDLHLIGHLQTNKVKSVIGHVSTVQSLDRMELAESISKRSEEKGIVTRVLVQVNIGKEPQKSGVAEEDLLPLLRALSPLRGIQVNGLMAIMPFVADPEEVRPLFRRMRSWFDRLRDEQIDNIAMNTLSMGMSDDCIVAAEEGATMVRLGRAIFGDRS